MGTAGQATGMRANASGQEERGGRAGRVLQDFLFARPGLEG